MEGNVKRSIITISIVVFIVSVLWDLFLPSILEFLFITNQGIAELVERYRGILLGSILIAVVSTMLLRVNGWMNQRRLEEKLEESEQQYKSLFKYNQSATFMLDLDSNFIVVNTSTVEITGYEEKELVGSSILPFVDKKYLQETADNLNSVYEGNSVTFETVIIHKAGENVFLTVNLVPIIVKEKLVGVIGIAHDDTNEKLAELKLQESERRYRSLINLSPEVIFVHSRDKIEFVNDKALSFIGEENKENIIGKTVYDFLHPEDKQAAAYSMALSFKQTDEASLFNEMRFLHRDGSVIITKVGANMIQYNGEPALLGVIHDITKHKESEQRLEEANKLLLELSQMDGLTGIPNRRFYEQVFENEWKSAIRNDTPISLIMLDIDCFKIFNDTYGHQLGDSCLKQVANALHTSLHRPRDFVARYGGEEFSVLLPETDQEGARFVAETLRAKVEGLGIAHENSTAKEIVTISVGVSTIVPAKDMEYKLLVEWADKALYKAKEQGRNGVFVENRETVV